MRNHLGTILFSFTALAACAGIGAANAQTYPIRSVTVQESRDVETESV